MTGTMDRLHADAIRAAMTSSQALRVGRLECIASVDSTNAELLRRGTEQTDLSVLIADTQTAGRGRRGRAWQSPPGANLYLSLYRRSTRQPRELGGLSLAVGVACAEALHALGYFEIRLKWPNDLLARGRKLGGVLIELMPASVVIGLGLNVRMPVAAAGILPHAALAHPCAAAAEVIDQAWTDLATLGATPARNPIAAAVLDHLLPALDLFEADGLEPFRQRWQALDAYADQEVRVQDGMEQFAGRALGIAPDGGLRVQLPQGERVFHSADVSLRPTQ